MYYNAAVKHGDIDVNKPSRFKAYKPDYKRVELEKALNAPPSQRWGCSSCGITAETWEIRCNNCDKIGTLNWI